MSMLLEANDRAARLRASLTAYVGVGASLIVLSVVVAVVEPHFATSGNIVNILETNAVMLIVAVGLTFVLLVGGFDLSVGGALALAGVVLAILLDAGTPIGLAIATVVAGGLVVGLVTNGLLIARFGLSFFVVTLGTASLFRGLALLLTDGATQPLYTQDFLRTIGSGRIGGVPWPVVIAGVVLATGIVVLRYTGFGRMVYAVGGSPEAAALAGINVRRVRMAVFGISAVLAAVAAVIEVGRLASAAPTQGTGLELTAGAAVLLGGTSFAGGAGTLLGTLLGALFLGVLSNGLSIAGISAFWQGIVAGCVLVIAVALDRLRRGTN